MGINTTKQLVVLQCKRVIEIIESGAKLDPWNDRVTSELKAKMHEIRRDTIRLENQIYRRLQKEARRIEAELKESIRIQEGLQLPINWLGTGEAIIITAIAIQAIMELYVYQKKKARQVRQHQNELSEKTIS